MPFRTNLARFDPMRKRILITGASGFIGSAVVKWILRECDHEILALTRNPGKLLEILELENHPRLRIVIATNEESLFNNLNSLEFDTVLHLATIYGRDESLGIESLIQTNLILPLNLLRIASSKGVNQFINVDTFYNKPNNSGQSLFDYSQSKLALVPWLKKFSSQFQVSNLILEHVYGPGDSSLKFLPTLISSAKGNYSDGLRLTPGHQRRDFIYSEDVASAIGAVISCAQKWESNYMDLQIGTGMSHSLVELASMINEMLGVRAETPFGLIPYPENEIMLSVADISILNSLGWRPKYSLEEGLRSLIFTETK